MGKVSFVVGVGVGYVLGARAGRRRYEQIKAQAGKVWKSDPVQDRVGAAAEAAKTKAAPFVSDKLGDAMKAVGQTMRSGSSSPAPARRSAPVPPQAASRPVPQPVPADRDGGTVGGADVP